LTKPEEKEEVSEYKATFLDELQGLEAARKYKCNSDNKNSIIIMHNKIEN
jgi:hypothetical protein